MANPNNQAIMVLRHADKATSTVPQTSACSLFVVVNQLHPAGGGQDKQTIFASKEALTKPTIGSRVASFKKVSSMSAMAATNTNNQLCNLPAESTCKGITVTLDNNNMWNEFFRCQTEMILTKQGRRMFPCCRFRISGLEPFQRYTLVMDMQPVDNYRYKWSDRRWETNGKADPHVLSSFVHPTSPATGLDWMQNPVSFYKLKLTNNPLDRDGHIIINSMHRYIPRLYIVPAGEGADAVRLDGPDVVTFSFSQTEFFAVTAYQNLSITQLKIDYNPFAKGFRDDANNSRGCKPKSVSSTDKLECEAQSSTEASALTNLKSLFAKMNASVNTLGEHKAVHYDGSGKVEPECSSSSMKRPWPGGLSDLIKGAQVTVKRISLEKIENDGSQQMNIESPAPRETESTSESASMPDVTMEVKEVVSLYEHTDSFSAADIRGKPNTSNGERTTVTDESTESAGKPPGCGGEVKKKRAEPVPLPLLALFLQQLKSKTRPNGPKTPSEPGRNSDQSCHDISVAETLSSCTAPSTPCLNTQLDVEPTVSPTSPILTSSSVSCTVSNADDESGSLPDSAAGAATASTVANHDAPQLPIPEEASATTSVFAHEVKPNTALADITPDTKTVSVTPDDVFSDCSLSCDSFLASTPEASDTELAHTIPPRDKASAEPSDDSCAIPSPTPVHEAAPQSPSPGDKSMSSPSCAPSPPYTSAPSSPDPFPPSMFHNRPIPPRKTLDPFPAGISLDRPRPVLDTAKLISEHFYTPPSKDPGPPFGDGNDVNCPAPDTGPPVCDGSEANCLADSREPRVAEEMKPAVRTSKGKKSKMKQKKGKKSKLSEDAGEPEGPIPAPMQPNLEEVEGQLFVSFMSKKALEIHLGDEVKEEVLQNTPQNINAGEVHHEKKSIDALEKDLLRDLKNMKYRQVIHPVLQAVGLKLNLLDVTLSIDLQYLGVCLPIPPASVSPAGSSETCSSQVNYVSRTGKTTDITKIKGWREKFSTTSSSSVSAATPSDTGQKNLSAFCSDMLDEYLESEGKLIDERAASFSQAVVTPVAYQLPTKSTSYVLTLDSVLKKQAFPVAATLANAPAPTRKTALGSKSRKAASAQEPKKPDKKKENPVPGTETKPERSSAKKSTKPNTPKSGPSPLSTDPEGKKSPKIKPKQGPKAPQNSLQTADKSVKDSVSVSTAGQTTGSPGSNPARGSGLPKTLVKLRDVEDGAVWEGKNRTYITMERAAIALSCLVTAEGTIGGGPSTVIKRRAPPCLNDFCRLGCVCASLVQERRQHHCGKPHCMLGCDCLRRKVVVLKNEDAGHGSAPQISAEVNEGKTRKKKRVSYILSGPDAAPEPALHVKTLWVKQNDADLEQIYVPDLAGPLAPPSVAPELQKDLENFLLSSPKKGAFKAVDGEFSGVRTQESLDCARVRPFCGRRLSPCGQSHMKECHEDPVLHDSLQEIEEGELRPPPQSGPTKRLEIVSKCMWSTEGSRDLVLHTVCERMAQDRLTDAFYVGKYQVQPTSKTETETDEGSLVTYKVVISQRHPEESGAREREAREREARIKRLEAQLIETIGKSEVKGLPLLSQVTPAGLLRAEKKPSAALGQIMVNGKLYPQAKLELGQMGALHPANRLAAYITGRVCVTNKQDVKADDTVTTPSHSDPSTPATGAMTTAPNTLSLPITSDKHTVAKQPMRFYGRSRINALQPKAASAGTLPAQGTVKNLIISSMMTGSPRFSVSSNMPPKTRVVSRVSAASGTTDGSIQVVTAGTGTGTGTAVLSTTGSKVPLPASGIRLMQPPTSTRPILPRQKMVMLKTGANPASRLVRLVPLSQFCALNPNLVVRPQQPTVVRLPAPNPVPLSKPQTFTTATSSPAPSFPTQTRIVDPAFSSTKTAATASITSTVFQKPGAALASSKTILVCSKPNAVKMIPVLLKDNSAGTLRIIPQKVFEEPQISTTPAIPSQSSLSSSEGHPTKLGLQIISKSCAIPSPDPPESDALNTGPPPAKEDSPCPKVSHENAVFADHSYTFEMKKTLTASGKPEDVTKDPADPANSSTCNMLLKEVPDVGPAEHAAGSGSDTDDESDEGSDGTGDEMDSDGTEPTEDSDMYRDTDSDSTQSSDEAKAVRSAWKELTEKETDELVDIETLEERSVKLARFPNPSSDHENDDEHLVRKRKDEKQRRSALNNSFLNLQQTLNMEGVKVCKRVLLSKAMRDINSLTKTRDRLVKMRDRLRKKRANYLQTASQLSGKNIDAVLQKLDEISAKQKSLENKDNNNDDNTGLRISKQTHRRLKNRRKVGTQQQQEAAAAAEPSLPADPAKPRPTPQLQRGASPISAPCETRPNILSLRKSQTLAADQVPVPQVIPVVPCNQIFTISNPYQPVDTSSAEKQPATPGVAAVSISIPTTSHPLCVETPLPILHPQALNMTISPANTPDDKSLPKISSVSSLLDSDKRPRDPMRTQAASISSDGKPEQNRIADGVDVAEEEKRPECDLEVKMEDDAKRNCKEGKESLANLEQEDERLMSLLDELVFLNQATDSQGEPPGFTEAGDVLTELLGNKDADMGRDDERSLSPLFLKLDEDLIASPTSKDEEIDDVPPKVDDLVKVIFGSESPSNCSESEVGAAAAGDDETRGSVCRVKHDAPTPPPLLHMKTGGCATADSQKEQVNRSWRPMPKLAPLGLKTQEAAHPKLTSSYAAKPD